MYVHYEALFRTTQLTHYKLVDSPHRAARGLALSTESALCTHCAMLINTYDELAMQQLID